MNFIWNDESNSIGAMYIGAEDNIVFINFFIQTRRFRGEHVFFIRKDEIEVYLNQLSLMYRNLDGKIEVSDNESDSNLRVEKIEDQWCFLGQFGCSWTGNLLMFRVIVDQTVIEILRSFFQSVI